MKNYCKLFFCFSVFLWGITTHGIAREHDIGVDLSLQAGRMWLGDKHLNTTDFTGLGGRVGYHVGSNIFLDGEVLHEASPLEESNQGMIVLGGTRFQIISDDLFGIFAKTRADLDVNEK